MDCKNLKHAGLYTVGFRKKCNDGSIREVHDTPGGKIWKQKISEKIKPQGVVEQVCQRLLDTYDVDVLDDVKDKRIPAMFKKYAFLGYGSRYRNKGNRALISLLYNKYYKHKIQLPVYINGPMSLTYHKYDEYDMKIYVFGEKHGVEDDCKTKYDENKTIDIDNYLEKIFNTSTKFIDFHLEHTVERKNISSPIRDPEDIKKSYLNNIRIMLSDCLKPVSKRRMPCVWKNVRTHYSDTRFGSDNRNYLFRYKFLKERETRNYMFTRANSLVEILSYLVDKLPSLVEKELDRSILPKELIITTLLSIWTEYYNLSAPEANRLPYRYRLFHTRLPQATKMKMMKEIYRLIGASIHDLYMIARIFKEFSYNDVLPSKQRHVIYYGGNYHSAILREFLYRIGFDEIKRAERVSRRCLNVTNIPIDFE
jgi:hypothetical protein